MTSGAWVSAEALSLDVAYAGEHSGVINLEFIACSESTPRITIRYGMLPNTECRLVVPLRLLDGQQVFAPRTPGRLKGVVMGSRLQRADLASVRCGLVDSGSGSLKITAVSLHDETPNVYPQTRPLVDVLGQRIDKDWPGKTSSIEELRGRLVTRIETLNTERFPEEWTASGAWRNRPVAATGWFRTEKCDGRWWLVDPDGNLFFSTGMDCVQPGEDTSIVPGTEGWHTLTPSQMEEVVGAYQKNGYNGAADFNYPVANLIRALGSDWRSAWEQMTDGLLRHWRFNTVANWSDDSFSVSKGFPHVTTLDLAALRTKTLLFRDFPDVYSPEFRSLAPTYAAPLREFSTRRNLIGYFMGNEPQWGFGKFNLAAEMLKANPGTATRAELARWLLARHGSEQALSTAWGRPVSAEMIQRELLNDAEYWSEMASADLWDFSRCMVREYTQVSAAACRDASPHHLNLGMRFAWISSDLLYEAASVFDVFSINNYTFMPSATLLDEIARRSGKPIMIGEFHFGAVDRGLSSNGLVAVATQAERGKAYRFYVENAATHPALVGLHYFILNDQGYLGRFDGENFQIGFLDVCLTEYSEIGMAAREANEQVYALHAGLATPTAEKPVSAPTLGF
ncbi:hypothetical protein [Nibricoccus sp. IMCC34717]|uniref:hypothetical protein n=1 Tax=Nibricoccus sp. IMCC34717 TaxID=3034021 RepID=UPI00384BCA0A